MNNNTSYFDVINTPADLRKLNKKDLTDLCRELRTELISTIGEIGGHFASSLGAVELSVAVHYCFETPRDFLVWDIGHQAYVHKMLTGRKGKLKKIRKLGGISGFPTRNESKFDSFGVAHAGTSISSVLGMLEAHKSSSESKKRHGVAIVGDGAMTAGMIFEALNHAGSLHPNLIVILNDNEMSIAPNVGALSWAFSKTLSSKVSTYARKHFKSLVEKKIIPKAFYRVLDKAEEATQGFLSTPAMLFTAFGFRYMGPIDGHDITTLIDALERAKRQDGPVIIHAITVKGKGYTPAEHDPVKYHAVSSLPKAERKKIDLPINPMQKFIPSWTEVFGKTMVELCKKDKSIRAITAAMADGTGLSILQKSMPEVVYDTGIAEQHSVTFAAGLACEGKKPVCAIYSTFLQRAYDQVIHDICIQKLPVIFAVDRGGLVGADGPTHHGVFDFAYLRTLPHMTIMAPKDEQEMRNMLFTALKNTNGPTAIRYPRGKSLGVPLKKMTKLERGKAEIMNFQKEATVLLVGIGKTVEFCKQASKKLHKYGILTTVVNARFVKPLDEKLFSKLIPEHALVVTVEDHVICGGFGSALSEFAIRTNIHKSTEFLNLGIPDSFIEHGTQEELYSICGIDANGITKSVKHRCEHLNAEKKITKFFKSAAA